MKHGKQEIKIQIKKSLILSFVWRLSFYIRNKNRRVREWSGLFCLKHASFISSVERRSIMSVRFSSTSSMANTMQTLLSRLQRSWHQKRWRCGSFVAEPHGLTSTVNILWMANLLFIFIRICLSMKVVYSSHKSGKKHSWNPLKSRNVI